MDDFTLTRLARFVGSFKQDHGRDVAQAELEAKGFDRAIIDGAVRKGVLDKYQVTNSRGSVENRYKLHRDWRSLKNG